MEPDARLLKALEPINLLVSMYYHWDIALRWHCGPIRRVYRRNSDDIIDAQCANCDREIETATEFGFIHGHAELEAKRKWLGSQGIPSKVFHREEEKGHPAVDVVNFLTNRRTLLISRNLAKAEVDAIDPAAQERFDQKFNLYFNQTYAYDWEDWRTRAPLETWP